MKKTFIEQLNEITRAAQQAITEQMAKQKSVVLFSATGDEDEEWTADIYSDIPDFPFYDKYGSVNYAAVREIHLNDQDVEITGILKGDSYPEEVKVVLEKLEVYSSAALADFMLPQLPENPETKTINYYQHFKILENVIPAFFSRQKNVDEEMNDWGKDGPIVETAFVSWTYGSLKLHDGEDDFMFLKETEGLIPIGNTYYGDFELLNADDPFLKGKNIVSPHDFQQLNQQTEN